MAKEFIGFGLIRKYADVRAIGITSEKRGQTYGRYLDNDHVAHWGRHDVFYRFPADTTPEFAMAASERAAKERAKHADGIEAARHRLRQLETARDEAVVDAAKGWGRLERKPEEYCARGENCVCADPSPLHCNAFADASKLPARR